VRRLNRDGNANSRTIPANYQVTGTPLLAIAFDDMRTVNNLQDVIGRKAMLPELRLIVLVNHEGIDQHLTFSKRTLQ